MHVWQMQEAKSRLSEVVKAAGTQGPQEITVHGRSVAVVLSRADFDKLSGTGESLVASCAALRWPEMKTSPFPVTTARRARKDFELSRGYQCPVGVASKATGRQRGQVVGAAPRHNTIPIRTDDGRASQRHRTDAGGRTKTQLSGLAGS